MWEIEEVEEEISVEYSSRMTRSLGRTQPLKKIIRLNLDVLSSLCQHLEEILCHELAHIAAVHKYGESISPHGQEWQSLVRQAGFEPNIRMHVSSSKIIQVSKRQFKHKCPICFSERIAKTRMTSWRCGSCVKEGMGGELIIEEVH